MAASCTLSRAGSLSTTLNIGSGSTSRLENSNCCTCFSSWQSFASERVVARHSDRSARYSAGAAPQRIANTGLGFDTQNGVHRKFVNRARRFTVCASAGSEDDPTSEKVGLLELA